MSGTPDRIPTAFERAFSRLAEGDREASREVFAHLWPKLLRFCQRAVGADAEDCAQRALMILFERLSTFDPSRSPLAWAYTIAAWECRTLLRTRSRSRLSPEADPEHAASDADSELALEERDLVQRALAVVASMSELDRATFEHEIVGDGAGSATERQRRHRMWARLRSAWRTMYGP